MVIILFFAGALFSIISLKYFSASYIWISVYWLICFGFLTLVSKKTIQKSIWFNLAFFIFLLGTLEGYLFFAKKEIKLEYAPGYAPSSEILGKAPLKAKTTTSKKYKGQQLLYDVSYTINDFGLRTSSASESLDSNQCVLFFGGSFTFGEGVEDHEAMPYVVQKLSKYQVYNFGFHGYGPHQMLAAIEHGMVEGIINCQPRVVVYQALYDHVARSAGLRSWFRHGPKYILQPNGSVSYSGNFDDGINIRRGIAKLLNKSFIYKKYFWNKDINKKDIDLLIEIINHSKNLLKEKYPKVEFHVIYWDITKYKFNKMVIEGLKSKGINLHFITEILPDYLTNASRYKIHYYDGHPNPLAHQRIAQYVVDRIISKK